MFHCEIIDDTFINGEPAAKGDKYEVDEAIFKQLVACKKAVACQRPEDSIPETPKPKVKKV